MSNGGAVYDNVIALLPKSEEATIAPMLRPANDKANLCTLAVEVSSIGLIPREIRE